MRRACCQACRQPLISSDSSQRAGDDLMLKRANAPRMRPTKVFFLVLGFAGVT